jgi:hypothetical protein
LKHAITQENINDFLNPWGSDDSKSPKQPPATARKSISPPERTSSPTGFPPQLSIPFQRLTPDSMPSTTIQNSFPPPFPSHEPPLNHPHSPIFSTPSKPGSLRDYLIDHGHLTLDQVYQLALEMFPEMRDREVRDVMDTDIQKGYLKSFQMKGRHWNRDSGLEFGKFLWRWE